MPPLFAPHFQAAKTKSRPAIRANIDEKTPATRVAAFCSPATASEIEVRRSAKVPKTKKFWPK